jgi:hypothetical protein
MQLKPCGAYMRTHQATTTGRDHAHPQSARITPTTRDNTIETWQTTCEAAEDERGRERPCPFARAIRTTKHQIKASTQSIPSCAVWRRSEEKEADGQKPETGKPHDLQDAQGAPTRPMPGPQDSHGYSHRRPQTHESIVPWGWALKRLGDSRSERRTELVRAPITASTTSSL